MKLNGRAEAITAPAGDKGSEFTPCYTLQDPHRMLSQETALQFCCSQIVSSSSPPRRLFLFCKIGDSCLFWKHRSSRKVCPCYCFSSCFYYGMNILVGLSFLFVCFSGQFFCYFQIFWKFLSRSGAFLWSVPGAVITALSKPAQESSCAAILVMSEGTGT